MSEAVTWVHEAMRKRTEEGREGAKEQALERRRFGSEPKQDEQVRKLGLSELVLKLKSQKFSEKSTLSALKKCLGSDPGTAPDEFFSPDLGALHGLVGVLTRGQDAQLQLLGAQCIANLAPISEKNGIHLSRAAGPYLITLLSSGSGLLQEAAGVAIGNLSLAGSKVAKVLLNQEVVESLSSMLETTRHEKVQEAGFYALYHLLHTAQNAVEPEQQKTLAVRCNAALSVKCAVEVYWTLFALSCNPDLHRILTDSAKISQALDIMTYEIFQKSDSRPLVKIVTPLVRHLANLCSGPHGESACLFVLRYPDLPAILMALLGTNYAHLCKESLWWFSNIVNSDSVLVQEELIELDLMDRLEYHTVQAVQKMDPYLTHDM